MTAVRHGRCFPALPPTVILPVLPVMSAPVLGLGMASAALVALLGSVTPVLRLKRLDVAAALAGK